jgi:hypothetical protein
VIIHLFKNQDTFFAHSITSLISPLIVVKKQCHFFLFFLFTGLIMDLIWEDIYGTHGEEEKEEGRNSIIKIPKKMKRSREIGDEFKREKNIKMKNRRRRFKNFVVTITGTHWIFGFIPFPTKEYYICHEEDRVGHKITHLAIGMRSSIGVTNKWMIDSIIKLQEREEEDHCGYDMEIDFNPSIVNPVSLKDWMDKHKHEDDQEDKNGGTLRHVMVSMKKKT